jgi:uncharacterized membrane protein YhaH (DUF805 family)
MIQILLATVWLGYRAHRVGRNRYVWGLIGALAIVAPRVVLVVFVLLGATVPDMSQRDAMEFLVFVNLLPLSIVFVAGIMMEAKQRTRDSSLSVGPAGAAPIQFTAIRPTSPGDEETKPCPCCGRPTDRGRVLFLGQTVGCEACLIPVHK